MNRLLRTLVVLTLALTMSGSVAGSEIEVPARELEAMLIAPCCFSQQVSVHHSAGADEVRQDIRKRLSDGETREQILDAYVAQYGKRILAQPPAEGMARVLYILPPLALVLDGGHCRDDRSALHGFAGGPSTGRVFDAASGR